MREWLVAGGLVCGPEGLLLVRNRRRDGSLDWSPPGGVIEVADGESVEDGLTREVAEETGITVTRWEGPVWEVDTVAEERGWHLRAEVHAAVCWQGDVTVSDPDGIVVDARFVPLADCAAHLTGSHPWVVEPLLAWLAAPEGVDRGWHYRLDGARVEGLDRVTRLKPTARPAR